MYYLSLGDSLAVGLQPGPTGADGPTAQGYPDQLEGMLRTRVPALRLVKLGCSGETTSTMIYGGKCRYPAGSQLAGLPVVATKAGAPDACNAASDGSVRTAAL